MMRVSGQSKSRPVKAAGAEVGAQQRNKELHVAVAKKHIFFNDSYLISQFVSQSSSQIVN